VARAKRNSRTDQQKYMTADPMICRANAEVAAVEVDDPLALEPGEKIDHAALDPERSAGAAAHASPDR